MPSDNFHVSASEWLDDFAASLQSANLEGVVSSFLPGGWLRDVLIFTWNNRSLDGQDKIRAYLQNTLAAVEIANVKLNDAPGLSPQQSSIHPEWIASGFTFTTAVAIGQGYFHLGKDASGAWKAQIVFMNMTDLKDHEELGPEPGLYGGHTLAWGDVLEERKKKIEENPHVIIVGAGQTGLNIAARFRQMNIPALVIEKNARVGDNWRKRYPTLTLHTPRTHHSFLYQPYPRNWPIFTPRDKLADWMENYAKSQDLVIWTNSRPLPTPAYDFKSKRWSVVIDRNGTHVTLYPAHIVLATGTLGKPRYPDMLNKDVFRGVTFHASEYAGGRPFAGKRVVVIGAGNTSADICQDLVVQGAQSVIMVQRSSTCVMSAKTLAATIFTAWPEGSPPEVADLKFFSWPLLLAKQMLSSREQDFWAADKEMHEGLLKAGLKLNMGSDGSGLASLVAERSGGYWIDVGCAELISAGKINMKQGVEPKSFTEDAIVFNDGSTLPADVVIFATGYDSIRDTAKDTFGEETIECTSHVWGLDEEGELRGCYRPSGHPGLWYGAGDFVNSRFSSKQMALMIKAVELGLVQF
ncbi:putative L-lysine 6-monooxygenase (NADPH-requiring) [Lyophyllum shimeji]|uniref:L-lysine 6-monooxygenase (NADPH-requiring) n=1 Tax=Lyophyllum shimeji TaxID=47721 RepID=A0A9P3UIA0_LYOSH|nr:putative L-lysine 6-monooxygenase (NADPH-requiring) [Lyophyllum shimeji]